MIVITITIPGKRAKPHRTRDQGPDLAALYHDLYDRLERALAEALKEARGATHDDFNPADHPQAPAGQTNGGQFVAKGGGGGGPTGPKPTSVKAKLTKAALHELLSSGHAFTKSEMLEIMGPAHKEVTLSTWLSKFKSQKHAGEYGALDIKKLPNGAYQVVMPNGQVAPPAPPDMVVKPEPKPAPKAPQGITVPPEPMPKSKADAIYADHMEESLAQLGMSFDAGIFEDMGEELPNPHDAVLEFKHDKALLMAQWATNTTGVPHEPKYDNKLYEADKILAKSLQGGASSGAVAKAVSEWKKNTQLEKQGKLKPGGGVKDPIPAGATKSMAGAMQSWHSDAPAPKPIPYDAMVPKTFEPITTADLTKKDGFQSGIAKLKTTLRSMGSADAAGNKKIVEAQLQAKLKDAPHFQALKAKATPGSYSLERNLISAWASSSGDDNSKSVALQLAVRDAFSIPAEHLETKALTSLKNGEKATYESAAAQLGVKVDTPESMASFRSALQEFVMAQHSVTQETLKAKGIDHIYVARGMKVDHGTGKVKVKLQPASSFSADYSTAKSFAGSWGTVFLAKVPASQVLSTYMTGFGCTDEHEVVVMGHHNIQSFVVPSSAAIDAAGAVEHVRSKLGVEK